MNGNRIPASYLAKFERDMAAYFARIGVQKKPLRDELPEDLRRFVRELVAYVGYTSRGGPVAVGNLASRADCERLGARIRGNLPYRVSYTCTQVRKVPA